MLRFALVATLITGCGDRRKEPAADPPLAKTADAGVKPAKTAPAPAALPRPPAASRPRPTGPSPDCKPVLAGIDIGALCGTPFSLVVKADTPGECALVPGPNAPRDQLVRIDVKRTPARRLPLTNPSTGWSETRGPLARGRRGAYPWLIYARSRGPGEPLCDGDELAAVTAKVAALLPPDPNAKEAPPNTACDAILSVAHIKKTCGAAVEPLAVGALEDGGDFFCRRYTGDRRLTLSIARPPRGDGKTVVDKRGNLAVVGPVGDYAVALKSSRRVGSGELLCDEAEITRLFKQVKARAAKALKK